MKCHSSEALSKQTIARPWLFIRSLGPDQTSERSAMAQACLTLGDPRNNPAVKNTPTLCTLLGGKYPPRSMWYAATAHAATCQGAALGACTSSRDGITDQTIFANDIWLLGETKLSRTTTKTSRKARQRQAWLTSCSLHTTSFVGL